MKPTTTTETTFCRISPYGGDRQIITVLALGSHWAYCAIETVARDGRNVEDTLGTVLRSTVPASIRNGDVDFNTTKGT